MKDAIGFGKTYPSWVLKKYNDQLNSEKTSQDAVKKVKVESIVPTVPKAVDTKSVAEAVRPATTKAEIAKINDISLPQKLDQDVNPFVNLAKTKIPVPGLSSFVGSFEKEQGSIPDVADLQKPQKKSSVITDQITKTVPLTLAPLEAPENTSVEVLKNLKTNIIDALKTKPAPVESSSKTTTIATVGSSTTNAVTNSTNVFGNTLDRDIPYIERNKYRQTLIYNRNLL